MSVPLLRKIQLLQIYSSADFSIVTFTKKSFQFFPRSF